VQIPIFRVIFRKSFWTGKPDSRFGRNSEYIRSRGHKDNAQTSDTIDSFTPIGELASGKSQFPRLGIPSPDPSTVASHDTCFNVGNTPKQAEETLPFRQATFGSFIPDASNWKKPVLMKKTTDEHEERFELPSFPSSTSVTRVKSPMESSEDPLSNDCLYVERSYEVRRESLEAANMKYGGKTCLFATNETRVENGWRDRCEDDAEFPPRENMSPRLPSLKLRSSKDYE
jgi:hypothetical protein